MSHDITHCTDGRCPSRKECQRYKKPDQRPGGQPVVLSYADFGRVKGQTSCDYFTRKEKRRET